MSNTLSYADQNLLTKAQQEQIRALKQAWADANAAGDQAKMNWAHEQAEACIEHVQKRSHGFIYAPVCIRGR